MDSNGYTYNIRSEQAAADSSKIWNCTQTSCNAAVTEDKESYIRNKTILHNHEPTTEGLLDDATEEEKGLSFVNLSSTE